MITATGAECLRRATIEFQSFFMGNKMEVLFGGDEPAIDIMDLQLMAAVMDPHIVCMNHLTIEQSKRALEVLKA